MAEAWVATFKNELVDGRRFPSFEHLEHEVLDFIGFYNDERLHEALDDVPPAEYEDDYYRLNIKTDNTPMLAITITLDRYGHLLPGHEHEAATLLETWLTHAGL